MSQILVTLFDDCHPLPHNEDMLDEWFRSLTPNDKVRLFLAEHEGPGLVSFPIERFLTQLDRLETCLAKADRDVVSKAHRAAVQPIPTAKRSPLAAIFDQAGNSYTVTLETACQLAGQDIIVERTSYSDDHLDGAEASFHFEVQDAAAFAREMGL